MILFKNKRSPTGLDLFFDKKKHFLLLIKKKCLVLQFFKSQIMILVEL